MEPSDAVLVRAAKAGDGPSFGLLVARHYDRIYRLGYRVLGIRAEAEDLAQDICAALPARLTSFRGEAAFTTWLHRLVLNAARDRLRRQAAKARASDGWGEVEHARRAEAAEAHAAQAWLDAALAALPGDLRETVALVLGEDLTHAQAAEVLEISEGTVSWRMSEVRRRLRALAEEELRA
ncbi:RNA polymerase sigma factor [Halovulum dunhuangense]|uniref:RNA polymerase sigma factor n=1 Tax=Halovulum dunhuangense TaxID=1505036 RepID=A0A849KUX8_9RHOB|nr:RNA polymerase sigma factor [Halovulum dunhuangense]NNU78825.1 RNA polymerase sigma factor [Halovulum dunhuangense]